MVRPSPADAISRLGGLVPRRVTTGGKPRLVGITKRGNKYLRKLIIHGARSALPILASRASPLGDWLGALLKRMHKNAAVVALANKLARIAWPFCGGEKSSTPRPLEQRRSTVWPNSGKGYCAATDICWWWKRDALTVDRRSAHLI